jgi:hypothetical protein
LAFVLRLVFAIGISGNDDMSVAAAALKVLDHGLHVPTGHYEARLGLVLPLVGLFALGGVHVVSLTIIPMAASLLGIFLAYRIGAALFDDAVGLLAACALAIYPMDVEYAALYFPDLIQGCLMALSFLLLLRPASNRGVIRAVIAGLVLGYAYYVKEDAVFMGAVLLLGAALGYMAWSRVVLAGAVAAGLVAAELFVYGALTGNPFLHAELVRRANNEVLAANMDYRDIWTYPKTMFFNPHEAGVTFYVAALGLILAAFRPTRPLLMVLGWCGVFLIWLSLGFDPFSLTFRLKPQLSRYLQDFSIPLCILAGWTMLQLWRHVPRLVCAGGGAVAAGLALTCMIFNALAYQAPRATRRALAEAVSHGWFPLYADVQSISIADFLLHDSSHRTDMRAAQEHDFLTGKTQFATIAGSPAYVLVNEAFAARLQQRNLVQPIDPGGFGMKATPIEAVGAGLPPGGALLLDAMGAMGGKIGQLAADARDPAIVRIYRMDK